MITPRQQICSAEYGQLVEIPVKINGRGIIAMIDSGATGNFMSETYARMRKVTVVDKKEPYQLQMADGSDLSSGNVNKETIPLDVAIQQHHEEITFDVVRVANHCIILGIPWLKKQNPIIDWKRGVLEFRETGNVTSSVRIHRQRLMVHEKSSGRTTVDCIAIISTQDNLKRGSDSMDTDKRSAGQQHERKKGKDVPLDIPKEYLRYIQLFQEEVDAKALPKHQPWDHEIELEPGKESTFEPIYALSEKELQVLRGYIEENLKKGFIRESKSLAGYPILFAPKKDGSLRLCVNYRKLNDITIKNRYLLLNIGELQD